MSTPTHYLAILLPMLLVTGGCASQAAMDTLQQDVNRLSEQVIEAKAESAQALQIAQGLQQDLGEVKASADAARDDASATRTLLEQLNARLDRQLGNQSFK